MMTSRRCFKNIFRFKTVNGMTLGAIIFQLSRPLYNVYFCFGAEFTISGCIWAFPIITDHYLKTSIQWSREHYLKKETGYLTCLSDITRMLINFAQFCFQSTLALVQNSRSLWLENRLSTN